MVGGASLLWATELTVCGEVVEDLVDDLVKDERPLARRFKFGPQQNLANCAIWRCLETPSPRGYESVPASIA